MRGEESVLKLNLATGLRIYSPEEGSSEAKNFITDLQAVIIGRNK